MDALQSLLDEIKRLQLLVCAQRNERRGRIGALTLDDAVRELRISAEECGRVARQLSRDGLLELLEGDPPARHGCVRLTERGKEIVARHAARRAG
jgi:DNA-binding MarR family transcriptional regulator